ncbi:hypothetical protein ACYJ1Y_07100 [Natrialbaceae archaeon A-gly3]
MAIELEATTNPPGLDVYDPIEQRHLHVRTAGPVSPRPTDREGFCFPVDVACAIETDELVFDQRYFLSVHAADGTWERSLETGETVRLESGTTFVGCSGPIQLYCRFDVGGTVETGINSSRLAFDEETTVVIGARSHHEKPVGTITTPEDPESIARAISLLPSALKTTSPERTWPTLRGHPPLLELGEDFETPADVSPPDSPITITVTPSYRELFTVAPLAFYLGAEIQLGGEPVLETPQFERRLGHDVALEDDVATLLKQCFFLDCLVRTEGIYQYDLYERARLETDLPFDPAAVYDEPLPAQLEQYLEVPDDLLDPYVPQWPLTAHVPAAPESVHVLPFVVNELGIVREPRDEPHARSSPTTNTARFARSAAQSRSSVDPRDGPRAAGDDQYVMPADTDESIEHAWFADGVPLVASKATLEAYRNQLSRDHRSESIEILLVCNDIRMLSEHDLLDEVYGNRERLPFDVDSEFGVDAERLARLLTDGGYDFVHYIGHATPDGLECPDGNLDVTDLESVDLGVFFLNACRSADQGLALVRRGAFGGVGTLSDVDNEDAVEVGETMARLLNLGFPLRAALEIARENAGIGEEYLILGDGSTDIAQTEGGAPAVVELTREDDETVGFSVRTYPTKEYRLGSATASNLPSVADRHLTAGNIQAASVAEADVREYLTWTGLPVLIDGDLRWNDGIGPASLE